ncbi:hypothetical protein K2Z84_20830 [Candidatus Binatia bacterium]|jgi:hypothetical protein|nr:hypothetical protein [Candidatus Binatia bacterium]
MRLATKRRVVHGALLLLAVWPLAHLVLAWRYDLSSWKLGGWGMYATPRFGLVGMEAYGRAAPDAAWQQVTAPSPAARDAANLFLEQHRWLRRLAPASDVARTLHADHPDWRELRLVVSYPVLDRASGRVRLVADERLVALPAPDARP